MAGRAWCRFAYFDKATMALLKACLSPEPNDRPTCGQLLVHDYFSSIKVTMSSFTAAAAKAQVCSSPHPHRLHASVCSFCSHS